MTADATHRPLSVFDELTARATGAVPDPDASPDTGHAEGAAAPLPAVNPVGGTPERVKQATQELLRLGVLYAEAKPNLYQAVLAHRDLVTAVLEPLDLAFRVDEVRGLVILVVVPGPELAPGEEWQHPLVRRQRLTLAQSLLLAILRRRYVEHEKTASGTTAARVPVEELGPELVTYLGDEGSDSANESRLKRLLEQLRDHGVVSGVDDDDQVTIRPLICHVADPTSLALLLHHYTGLAAGPTDDTSEVAGDER